MLKGFLRLQTDANHETTGLGKLKYVQLKT